MCVCGGGGGGGGGGFSDFFLFPKFQAGPTYVIQVEGGGGGASNFFPRGWSPIAK